MLVGFCDSDFFSLGSGVFSWCSKKQQVMSQSFTKTYILVGLETQQAIWLKRILKDFREKQDVVTIHCNNKSTIAMAKNPVFHRSTKYIAIKHQFIREAIEGEEVQLKFCWSSDQLADIFTKTLPRDKFQKIK